MQFGEKRISFKWFSKIIFVPWGIVSLVRTSKIHKKIRRLVARENPTKNKIVKGYKKGVVSLRHWTSSIHNQLEIPNTSNWLLSWIQFSSLYLELWWLVSTGIRYHWIFLTKITITFVALISPNFWGGHTHQFLYHFLE